MIDKTHVSQFTLSQGINGTCEALLPSLRKEKDGVSISSADFEIEDSNDKEYGDTLSGV